jgi:hypothetical protein
MSESSQRRPALILLTQALLLFVIIFVLYTVGDALIMMARGEIANKSTSRVAVGVAGVIASMIPLALLFYGLVRRRHWAWFASLGFATLLCIGMVYSVVSHPSSADAAAPAAERVGYRIGTWAIPVLLCVYVVRLYFSPHVRSFLGVDPRMQSGR